MVNGVINIYKEKGYTSHDVVAKLRGIFHQKKIGHTGTLDPDAEGVLPVCLGAATKLCDLLTDHDKTYEAVLLLGVETDTQDVTGEVLHRAEVTASPEEVNQTIQKFCGTCEQVPPMYSARKVNGKRLYELARKGQTVERTPAAVEIRELEILEMRLPEVFFRVTCSRGTYIRTLCHDIGQALGCGGCMKHLTRTRVGEFRMEDSIRLGELECLVKREQERASEKTGTNSDSDDVGGTLKELCNRIIPIDQILRKYPARKVSAEAERLLYNGNPLEERHFQKERTTERMQNAVQKDSRKTALQGMEFEKAAETEPQEGFLETGIMEAPTEEQSYRVYDTTGKFCALYAWRPEKRRYCPVKMFL